MLAMGSHACVGGRGEEGGGSYLLHAPPHARPAAADRSAAVPVLLAAKQRAPQRVHHEPECANRRKLKTRQPARGAVPWLVGEAARRVIRKAAGKPAVLRAQARVGRFVVLCERQWEVPALYGSAAKACETGGGRGSKCGCISPALDALCIPRVEPLPQPHILRARQ